MKKPGITELKRISGGNSDNRRLEDMTAHSADKHRNQDNIRRIDASETGTNRNYVEICTRPSETLPFQTAFQTVSNNLSGLIVPVIPVVPIAPVSFLGTEMAVPLVTSVVVPVVVIT